MRERRGRGECGGRTCEGEEGKGVSVEVGCVGCVKCI